MKKVAFILKGNQCETLHALYKYFEELFSFPNYFSENWDSFEEILVDFFKGNYDSVIIIENAEAVLKNDNKNQEIFFSILNCLEEDYGVKTYKV